MKVLRIKAFQETACYRKPFSNKVTETYPLPPYSTVKGMIHAIINADKLIPFSLSIQGHSESQMIDYKKTYFVKKREFAMPIITEGLKGNVPIYDTKTMSSMPLYTHLLYNVELIFHIKAEVEILEKIWDAFHEGKIFVSLGRYEDLMRIDKVDYVSIKETDECFLKHSVYIPERYLDEEERGLGIPYLLNWTYQIKQGIREWGRIPTVYVNKNQSITTEDFADEELYVDEHGYPVFWN